jgi:hypothetical protein
MRGVIPPLSQYALMAWCLVKHRDNYTFTFICMTTGTVATNKLKDFKLLKDGPGLKPPII